MNQIWNREHQTIRVEIQSVSGQTLPVCDSAANPKIGSNTT